MYITSIKSSRKIVHRPGCYHLNHVCSENRIYHNTLKSALSEGCHVCADCMKAEKRFDDNFKKINTFAQENKMNWDISDEGISIRTKSSGWKIIAGENEKYSMYHANDNGISQRGDKMPGYHYQNAHCTNIFDYFNYVVEHDNYRKKYITKPTKRKGTPGYKNQMKMIEKKRKFHKVVNVYNLIDSLGINNKPMAFAS